MSRVNGPYVIRHGDVWKQNARPGLVDNGLLHVCDGTGEMAIAYQGDVLLKIGGASSVDAWLDANREKFDQMREMFAGMGEDDEDLELVVLRLPVSQAIVDELNLCIAISGRVARLRENLERIGVDDPSLFDRPRYPS